MPLSYSPSISFSRITENLRFCKSFGCFQPSSFHAMSLRLIPHTSLHVSRPTWWLESRFHFSFAEYFNPQNQDFGVLRVLNDDLVQHRNIRDTWTRLCAVYERRTGITHSEMNNDADLLRFLQIWIKPQKSGLKPNYGSRVFKKEDRHNKFQHVLTSFEKSESEKDQGVGVIPIHQDANIYVVELDPGYTQQFVLLKNRQAYLTCIEGGVSVNDKSELVSRDAMEIKAGKTSDYPLTVKADTSKGAHLLLIEMPLSS